MRIVLQTVGGFFAVFGVLSVLWGFGGALLGLFIGGGTEIMSTGGLVKFIVTRAGTGAAALACAVFLFALSSRVGSRRGREAQSGSPKN